MNKFKSLTKTTDYKYDDPDRNLLLETFENKMPDMNTTIEITAPEFTCLCPITGQPDFAEIYIRYKPFKLCLESKSLKLYLGSFRMYGTFHEACIQKIADDLIYLLSPIGLYIEGRFMPRGGIKFWPNIKYGAWE